MVLAPSRSLFFSFLFFLSGQLRATSNHQSGLYTSVLNSHSVSLCTLFLHSSACHIQGYTHHEVTSQQYLCRPTAPRGPNSLDDATCRAMNRCLLTHAEKSISRLRPVSDCLLMTSHRFVFATRRPFPRPAVRLGVGC